MSFFLLLSILNLGKPNVNQPIYWHIGYKNCYPVFLKKDDGRLDLFQMDDSLHLKRISYDRIYRPLFINDCALASIDLIEANDKFLVYKNNQWIKIETSFEVKSIGVSRDCNYYVSSSNDSIYVFRGEKMFYKTDGIDPTIIGDYVYYSYRDDSGGSFVSLYRFHISNPVNQELIIPDIYAPGILVFDDGNHIACNINKDGSPARAIYNVKSKNFTLINLPNEADFPYPVYLPRKKSIIYYNPTGLQLSKEMQIK